MVKEESRDGDGVAYQLDWSLDKVGNPQLETRLKAKDAAATNWTGGSLTRVVSGYSANGTDWLNATTTTRGTTNAAGEAFVGATTATQTGYGYDSNGAQVRKTTESADASNSEGMEWSFEGALLRVEKGENNATRFTYDAGGNRVQALTRDGAKMSAANYLVDENTAYAQVLEERDSTGTLQARYVYGQGYGPILLQRRQKNAANVEEIRTRYLLADGHGSVRQLVTEAGVVTDSYFYDAWGGGLSGGSGNTVNPYRYNGQQTDEATGGYYLRARYYQPGNGRFLGHDPLLGHNDDPASLHRYLYAGADGVNGIDPSGKANLVQAIAITAITTALVSTVGISVKEVWRLGPDWSTTFGFNSSKQATVDGLKEEIYKSNPTAEDVFWGLENVSGTNDRVVPELGSPHLGYTRNGFFGIGYIIVLNSSLFSETKERQMRILIHESLHAYTGGKGNNVETDPIHRRVYGWARTFQREITETGNSQIPDNLWDVIVNGVTPTPIGIRYDGDYYYESRDQNK